MCPKGDDPITNHQNYREIGVNITRLSLGDLTGEIGIVFFGEISYISLSDPSNSTCVVSLEGSSQIGGASCVYVVENSHYHQIYIQFIEWPEYTNEVNMNDGNPSINDFFCDISQTSSDVQCRFTDIENSNLIGNV
jgi:hypothetical protein